MRAFRSWISTNVRRRAACTVLLRLEQFFWRRMPLCLCAPVAPPPCRFDVDAVLCFSVAIPKTPTLSSSGRLHVRPSSSPSMAAAAADAAHAARTVSADAAVAARAVAAATLIAGAAVADEASASTAAIQFASAVDTMSRRFPPRRSTIGQPKPQPWLLRWSPHR